VRGDRRRLTALELATMRAFAERGLGGGARELAEEFGITSHTVKQRLQRIYEKLEVPSLDSGFLPHILLAYWWNCELFQVGLRELGLLTIEPLPLKPRMRLTLCNNCLEGHLARCQSADCPCVCKDAHVLPMVGPEAVLA